MCVEYEKRCKKEKLSSPLLCFFSPCVFMKKTNRANERHWESLKPAWVLRSSSYTSSSPLCVHGSSSPSLSSHLLLVWMENLTTKKYWERENGISIEESSGFYAFYAAAMLQVQIEIYLRMDALTWDLKRFCTPALFQQIPTQEFYNLVVKLIVHIACVRLISCINARTS